MVEMVMEVEKVTVAEKEVEKMVEVFVVEKVEKVEEIETE